jgi:hypothetical protein
MVPYFEQNIDWRIQIVQSENSVFWVTDLDRIEYSIGPDVYAMLSPQLQAELSNYAKWWQIGRRRAS